MYFKLVESLDLKAESSSLLTFDFQLLTEELMSQPSTYHFILSKVVYISPMLVQTLLQPLP